MATIKAIIKPSAISKDGKVNIKIRITHKRKLKVLSTNYHILPNEFDNNKGKVRKKHPNAAFLNLELQSLILDLEKKIIDIPDNVSPEILFKIIQDSKNTAGVDFFSLTKIKIDNLAKLGKKRTSEIYQSTYNMLQDYNKLELLDFQMINIKYLSDLEFKLKLKGLKTNAIGVHMRNIRSVFNLAIDEEIIGLEHYPFRRYNIARTRTWE